MLLMDFTVLMVAATVKPPRLAASATSHRQYSSFSPALAKMNRVLRRDSIFQPARAFALHRFHGVGSSAGRSYTQSYLR